MARRGLRILLILFGVATLFALTVLFVAYRLVGRAPSVPNHAVLTLSLSGDLTELPPSDVVGYLQSSRTRTLRSVVDNLRKAKVDDRVSAVLLKPSGFTNAYWGKVQELRDAVKSFRESGKPIYAYLEYGGDREYYLASAADKVFLMPSSSLDLTGVASYELFLRGTLDWLGIYPDLHHVGAYKNAVNTFTERTFTEAHREASEALTRGVYDEIVRGIAEGRGRTEEDVRAIIDEGPFLPEEAVEARLVDGLAYEDQVEDQLRAAGGIEGRATVRGDDYARVPLRLLGLGRGPRVALIHVNGVIASGRSGYDAVNGAVVGADTLNEYIRRVRRDTSIRAIVLRIDSPGGSATASDAVWRELMLTRESNADRPIVASMSDVAASGGYYVALPAHAIVAQPSTLTGSIGVFGGKFVTDGLYEKFGANIESVSAGRHAEINSPIRPYTEEEAIKVQAYMQNFYDRFVEKVAASRSRTPEEIDDVAQGRVWTGRQAQERGLIDALGGLNEALAIAKERARIPADSDVELVVYPPRRTFFEILSEELTGSSEGAEVQAALRMLRAPLSIFRPGEPLALLPSVFLR